MIVFETLVCVLPLMLSPGPANLVSFALGARFGLSRLLFFLLGIVSVYLFVAICFGSAIVQFTSRATFFVLPLKCLGGLFIIYLGAKLMKRRPHDSTPVNAPNFYNGATLQLVNPKYPAVVMTVFAHAPAQPVLFTASLITLVGASGLLIYAAAGSVIHQSVNSTKWFRPLDIGFGLALSLVGLTLLVEPFMG